SARDFDGGAGWLSNSFQVGTSGSDHLWIAVNDTPNANAYSDGWVIKDFTVAAPINHAPVATQPLGASIAATSHGQVFQASQLFSATDPDKDALTYAVLDFTPGTSSGHFIVNGQEVAA